MSTYEVATIFPAYIKSDFSHLFRYICKLLFLYIPHLSIIFEILKCFASDFSQCFNVTLYILHLFHCCHHILM